MRLRPPALDLQSTPLNVRAYGLRLAVMVCGAHSASSDADSSSMYSVAAGPRD